MNESSPGRTFALPVLEKAELVVFLDPSKAGISSIVLNNYAFTDGTKRIFFSKVKKVRNNSI